MTWIQRHQLQQFFQNSFWMMPMFGMTAALATAHLLHWCDDRMGWQSPLLPDTARSVLATLASAMFTFIVFVCSALLVAVQLASAQLTPRVIAFVFRDAVTKFAMTLFIFTFTFSVAALLRVDRSVPTITTHVAAYGCVVSLAYFVYLVDHVGKALRPSGALHLIGRLGRQVIESTYPEKLAAGPGSSSVPVDSPHGEPALTIPCLQDGVILAFDPRGLARLAEEGDCVIEMLHQVGDSVAVGEPLFHLFQGGTGLSAESLYNCLAIGEERTLEQDPAFAFRIIVDIACKGLASVNDPTTVVLAIDQIHLLLRSLGNRCLEMGHARDQAGRLRLVYHTPDWDDFVTLAVTEIRQLGGSSIQVVRRLHAMLENLIQTLPPYRAPQLQRERDLLRRSAEHYFTEVEDRALADVSDVQGIGGKRALRERSPEGLPPRTMTP